MATVVYENLKKFMFDPSVDITSAGAIGVALVEEINPTITTSAAYVSAVMGTSSDTELSEVSGTNYFSPGSLLQNVDFSATTESVIFLDGDDITWTNSNGTISAGGCLLYLSGATLDVSKPLAYLDFAVLRISVNDNFTLQWLSDGIITLT